MALDILGKHSTTEPHFQPVEAIFQSGRLTEAQEFQARLGNTEEATLNQESFDSRRPVQSLCCFKPASPDEGGCYLLSLATHVKDQGLISLMLNRPRQEGTELRQMTDEGTGHRLCLLSGRHRRGSWLQCGSRGGRSCQGTVGIRQPGGLVPILGGWHKLTTIGAARSWPEERSSHSPLASWARSGRCTWHRGQG